MSIEVLIYDDRNDMCRMPVQDTWKSFFTFKEHCFLGNIQNAEEIDH